VEGHLVAEDLWLDELDWHAVDLDAANSLLYEGNCNCGFLHNKHNHARRGR